jgi:hypothetical protein
MRESYSQMIGFASHFLRGVIQWRTSWPALQACFILGRVLPLTPLLKVEPVCIYCSASASVGTITCEDYSVVK